MIDLHCHILPGIDDGSASLEISLEMARIAVADGITHTACTPHVMAGVYENDTAGITHAVKALQGQLQDADIPLALSVGADVHVSPDLVERLNGGSIPTLHRTRYFLFEPPHDVRLPGLGDLAKKLIAAGYIPILTHPERLRWIETHYDVICDLCDRGALMQLTAGSITGRFGSRARYWSERMLDEGRVHLVATDAHDAKRRPPILSQAREAISVRLGSETAIALTERNPRRVLGDEEFWAMSQ